jgi:hypothetical protein
MKRGDEKAAGRTIFRKLAYVLVVQLELSVGYSGWRSSSYVCASCEVAFSFALLAFSAACSLGDYCKDALCKRNWLSAASMQLKKFMAAGQPPGRSAFPGSATSCLVVYFYMCIKQAAADFSGSFVRGVAVLHKPTDNVVCTGSMSMKGDSEGQ